MTSLKNLPNEEIDDISTQQVSPKSPTKNQDTSVLGIIIMSLSNLSFAIMTVLLKFIYMRSNITIWEVTMFRGMSLFLFNLPYANAIGVKILDIAPDVAKQLLGRVAFGIFAISTFYLSNKLLPVSLSAALCATDPIFTAIIGWLVFSERITKYDMIALFCAFCGVLCIVMNPYRNAGSGPEIKILYMLVPIFSAIACGFVYNFTRQLAQLVHWVIAPTYFGLGIACVVPIFMLTNAHLSQHVTEYSYGLVLLIFVMYIMGWLGQLLMSKALQIEVAGRVTLINYSQIVMLFISDVVIFKYKVNYVDVLGTVMIIGCNFTIALLKFLNKI